VGYAKLAGRYSTGLGQPAKGAIATLSALKNFAGDVPSCGMFLRADR